MLTSMKEVWQESVLLENVPCRENVPLDFNWVKLDLIFSVRAKVIKNEDWPYKDDSLVWHKAINVKSQWNSNIQQS